MYSFPEANDPPGPRNRPVPRPRRRRDSPLAVPSHPSAAGIRRSLHGPPVRRYQSLRHSREAGDDHAEGYPVGEEDSRRVGRTGVGGFSLTGSISRSVTPERLEEGCAELS